MFNLKPLKRTLRNAGFVLDDFATQTEKVLLFWFMIALYFMSDNPPVIYLR